MATNTTRTNSSKAGLTNVQRQAAQRLRNSRPPVIAGTNVIFDPALRAQWYATVTATLLALKVTQNTNSVNLFCNIAGVPD